MKPRKILVTGTTRGLGQAMTKEFIQRHHLIAGCGRSEENVKRLRSQYPAPHRFDAIDITDDAAVGCWAAEVLKIWGVPDLLINNAAIVNRSAPLWTIPAEEFNAVIDINLKGMVNVIRHIVPAMVERGHGVIVNLSSGWGRTTSPGVAPYCASKWAVEGLTRSLAQELPKGMAAIPLNPGIIDTDMLRTSFGAEAHLYPSAEFWAKKAVPFLLRLGPDDNGKPLAAPQ